MNAAVFVDTNILLYSIDEEPGNAAKRRRAQELLLSERWGWSIQVAAEFFVNATSPKRPFKLAASAAVMLVESWLVFPTLDVTPALFRNAVDVQQRFQLNYWDAAIIAAASQMGCGIVYSEDLNDGQSYDSVAVVNPFKRATA